MRNIKFRAIGMVSREWVYGYLSANTSIEPNIYFINTGKSEDPTHMVDGNTVGQFTGLKDSKRTKEFPEGQEVYEKDIVEDERQFRYLVVWSDIDCCYYFELLGVDSIGEGELFDVNEIGGYKIIGNEHQTPELLKTENKNKV